MKKFYKAIATAGTLGLAAIGFVAASGPASAAVCNDGWYSSSSGRGTCSYHGGIQPNSGYVNPYTVPKIPNYTAPKNYGYTPPKNYGYTPPKSNNYGYGGGYGSGSKYKDPYSQRR